MKRTLTGRARIVEFDEELALAAWDGDRR